MLTGYKNINYSRKYSAVDDNLDDDRRRIKRVPNLLG